ncbi:unnamed protein product [Acanthoscelides obtectus]|uniref:Gamma-interferon-inducible lysosomal thiol reductase n=1 Tax=Acanthoscelides obtectus TaxID=200917 RepID=A0A9P0KBH3_ACAOB|nr:unnamed protein product [Acanthoscelides obtectus]CAK1633466.1 Gamma-interferon-inducible lysosomal thiol reductase [Acanthoscelides obtectus]
MLLKAIIAVVLVTGTLSDTVKVSIYYEALCGDSIRFIAQQLHPNFPKLADYIDLDLVPYGKAVHSNIHGTYYFSCQHGPAECKGNVYQSCALSQNQGDRKNVEFVNCIMRRNPDHFVNVEKEDLSETSLFICLLFRGEQSNQPVTRL